MWHYVFDHTLTKCDPEHYTRSQIDSKEKIAIEKKIKN